MVSPIWRASTPMWLYSLDTRSPHGLEGLHFSWMLKLTLPKASMVVRGGTSEGG